MTTNEPISDADVANVKKFALILAILVTVLVALPALIAFATVPAGQSYLGSQFNFDDHMVYAAWMRQAMDGHFLFDNRFAVDPQPGLTVHLYFLVLGWVAKLITIPLASTLGRLGFTFLFVILLARLLVRLNFSVYASKFALLFATFGAGLGYLQWSPFGRAIDDSHAGITNGLLQGRLSIDVWQPEAFAFPSMLTNGLFMVSLCLILVVLDSVVQARSSWKPVLPGALAMLALMNIHSYDVLLLALVLVGFLVAVTVSEGWDSKWVTRSAVIGLGAVPSTLWFLYVLSQDPVFQARAATPTYSPTFRQIIIGVLPGIILAAFGLMRQEKPSKREWVGFGVFTALVVALIVASDHFNPDNQYFLTPLAFAGVMVAAYAVVGLKSRPFTGWNLFLAWAVVSLFAPYFPGLFQRKLSMAMMVPWGVLAACGMAAIANRLERQTRNLVSALVLVVACATSIYWFQRELLLISNNVSTTTVQPVFFTRDVGQIVDYLNKVPGRKVVVSPPGIPMPSKEGFPYRTPYIPDLSPVFSGMAGAYTYAGHWSETPDYAKRRAEVQQLYDPRTPDDLCLLFLNEKKIDYIVVPDPGAFDQIPIKDLRSLGEVVYDGTQFDLIKITR